MLIYIKTELENFRDFPILTNKYYNINKIKQEY